MNLSFQSISKSFGSKTILDSVTFEVPSGEIAFFLGKSGAGKSVTLKLLCGLIKADVGSIRIGDEDITRREGTHPACGMVFQHPALFDSLSVLENVTFGLRLSGLSDSEKKARAAEVLEQVQLVPREVLSLHPVELSYGMQKRVSLARTLAPRPRILLFDEPTTGLDPVTTHAINQLILELSRSLKTTSLVVSHDMQCAIDIADRIFVLDGAKIVESGTTARLLESSIPLVRDFLLEVQL